MTRHDIETIKNTFQPGMRILLHEMKGEPRMYDGLEGTIGSVDDIGQIHVRWDNGSSLALNYEEDSFELTETPNRIQILLIEPGKYPKTMEINDSLESMQSLVGGYIEEYCPFDDDVAIVCNDEGKINGLPLNRAIYDSQTNELLDIIAGNFFLVGTPTDSDSFQSLTQEQQMKYSKMFKYPERFTETYGKISAEKYKPVGKDQER
ncbi:MAG: DUF3846 domain-containing protein [Erysipelotrichaceae bacterium]|nr:DUF3846 domain-containing protein [Erysipelotrichaceae bacterium]